MTTLSPDWYLRDWMQFLGRTQADLRRRTGWGKSRAHNYVHGITNYTRGSLNQAAAALEIQPYELLMPPEDAMLVRHLASALRGATRPGATLSAAAQAPVIAPPIAGPRESPKGGAPA